MKCQWRFIFAVVYSPTHMSIQYSDVNYIAHDLNHFKDFASLDHIVNLNRGIEGN